MRAPARIGLYVAGLGVVFVASAAIAGAVVPEGVVPDPAVSHAPEQHVATGDALEQQSTRGAAMTRGLSLEQDGYTLGEVEAPATVGEAGELAFTLTGPAGEPVTEFDVSHEQQLHLIVVRSDGAHFRHVHPVMDADGRWSLPWTWDAAGTYRIYADAAPSAGDAVTLTRTIDVAGELARDVDRAGQRDGVARAGRGVGVDAVGPGSVPGPGQRPAPVRVHHGVDVAKVRAVGAHDDQVQLLLVRDVELGDGLARGAGEGKGQLSGLAHRRGRLDLAQRVPVLLQGQTAGHGRSSRALLLKGVARGDVLLRGVGDGRVRHDALGDHGTGDRGRGDEHDAEPRDVQPDPGGGSHGTRTAWYPASSTAATTAASSRGCVAVTTSLPVAALTSICSTPGTWPTSSRTDISQ